MRVETAQAVSPQEPQPSQKRAQAAAAAQNARTKTALEAPANHSISVEVEGKRVYFQVVDQGTGEVVRKVPPEAVRRVGRNVARMLEEQAQDENHVVDVDS